jgi:hypothetical protein
MGADPALEAAKKLQGWIRRVQAPSFSIRDAHQELRKHHLTPAHVERAAMLLIEHGYLRAIPPTVESAPGRPPSPRFAVNPHWAAQNAPIPQNPTNDGNSMRFADSEDCVREVEPEPSTSFEDCVICVQPPEREDDASDAWDEVVF